MSFEGFLGGLLGICLLTVVLHVVISRIASRIFFREMNSIWDRETSHGYIPQKRHPTRRQYQQSGRKHVFQHPAGPTFVHVGGTWTPIATIVIVFIPLMVTFILGCLFGWIKF